MGDVAVRDETITLNGLRCHYRDWGDPAAPPLVLLHGFLCHARMFDPVAALMSDRYRVLALDQRGHGESDHAADYRHERLVEDCAAFVAALDLPPAALVGYSFGGQVAVSYAARHPERVTRMVLVESAATATPEPGAVADLQHWRTPPPVVADPEEAERALRPIVRRATGDALLRFVRDGLARQADGRWAWRWDPVHRVPAAYPRLVTTPERWGQALAGVRCPALVVRGAESDFFPLAVAEQTAATLAHGRVASIPDAGHFLWFETPAAVEATIRDFLLADEGATAVVVR